MSYMELYDENIFTKSGLKFSSIQPIIQPHPWNWCWMYIKDKVVSQLLWSGVSHENLISQNILTLKCLVLSEDVYKARVNPEGGVWHK